MKKKNISIVLPLYNESQNLLALHQRLSTVIDGLESAYHFEIIMVDDGSSDNSWHVIASLAKIDSKVSGLRLTRNFGKEAAMSAGYDCAEGDAVITMDGDLQHPPEVVPSLLDAWNKGYYIVYVRSTRHYENFFKKMTAFIFYKLLDAISSITIPSYVQDFRLVDRRVVDVIRQSREKSRYLRGLVAWTGFSHTFIEAPYAKRFKGESNFSLTGLLKISFNGLTGFSLVPLKIAAYVGAFVMFTGFLMFTYISIDAFFFSAYYPLFKWLVTIIYIFIGVLFILLWILGEYIGRIYEELKGRPLYLISQQCNIEKNNSNLRDLPLNRVPQKDLGL